MQMLGRREYRRVRARWTERRCVRDPPGACLPVPPVEYHAVPVTLTWHEASVVQLYSEAFDATFHDVISLCGGTFFLILVWAIGLTACFVNSYHRVWR